ncbi:transporter substrate-binding domain-containing protein [Roseovarius pacificus]|uniref:transporter substrate-binding domain-containing protein n=1 Tax=Roseovarius pacificus TaxID=337701 RepID=UPI002A1893F2|nr:transporter substrate-binding domain-containing protein [Roseovarius pacificus]
MTRPDDATRRELAPHGVLRVALNHGNFLLVGRDADRAPFGISVDLARALAAEVDLPLEFVEYERAGDVSGAATEDAWDVCFLAIDPKRRETIAFTDPYVQIDGCYLAGPGCTAESADALVASGASVGSVAGSAYTLRLERLPGHEALRPLPSMATAIAQLKAGEVAAIAGIREAMEHEAAAIPSARVLLPPFMEIRQAMATPAGRPRAIAAVTGFVAEMIRSGQAGDILERHGVARSAVPHLSAEV